MSYQVMFYIKILRINDLILSSASQMTRENMQGLKSDKDKKVFYLIERQELME